MTSSDDENRLVDYTITVAVIKDMERTNRLSKSSARLLYARISERYEVGKDSIFLK